MLPDTRRTASLLGAAGLLPFLALAAAIGTLPGASRTIAAGALLFYGAGILSFLGAVHWGFAISAPVGRAMPVRTLLVAGVVPQLVSFGALLLPTKTGLFVLAAAIVVALALDAFAVRQGAAPPWWLRLRVALSVGAGILLAIGGLLAQ